MQKWEYLEIFLDYYGEKWHGSMGRQGELVGGASGGHPGTLLNELGQQGWELAGVEAYPHIRSGYTRSGGAHSAKWLFKRPSTP